MSCWGVPHGSCTLWWTLRRTTEESASLVSRPLQSHSRPSGWFLRIFTRKDEEFLGKTSSLRQLRSWYHDEIAMRSHTKRALPLNSHTTHLQVPPVKAGGCQAFFEPRAPTAVWYPPVRDRQGVVDQHPWLKKLPYYHTWIVNTALLFLKNNQQFASTKACQQFVVVGYIAT